MTNKRRAVQCIPIAFLLGVCYIMYGWRETPEPLPLPEPGSTGDAACKQSGYCSKGHVQPYSGDIALGEPVLAWQIRSAVPVGRMGGWVCV